MSTCKNKILVHDFCNLRLGSTQEKEDCNFNASGDSENECDLFFDSESQNPERNF